MKDTGGPYLGAAFLCENVIEGKDGVYTYVRAIDRWTITAKGTDAPEQIPPDQKIEFYLVVLLKAGKARGRAMLSVDLEKPSGEFGKRIEMPLIFEGEDRGVLTIAKVVLPVDQEGVYWFHLTLDKSQFLTKVPFRVVYQPLRGSGLSTPS